MLGEPQGSRTSEPERVYEYLVLKLGRVSIACLNTYYILK